MAATKIISCNCEHEYQDSKYGKKMRVHNCGEGKDKTVVRCTVCGNKKNSK